MYNNSAHQPTNHGAGSELRGQDRFVGVTSGFEKWKTMSELKDLSE